MPETRKIVLERRVRRRMQPKTIKSHLDNAMAKAMKSGRGSGWTYNISKIHPVEEMPNGEFVYNAVVTMRTTSERSSLLEKFPSICKRLAQAASAGGLRKAPWTIIDPEGYEEIAEKATAAERKSTRRKELAQEPKELGDIIIDPANHFDRLFGREAQIRRVLAALSLAKATEYKKRPHLLFCGDPGGGKTEMTQCIQRMIGLENEAWLRYDAPSMTKAGALEDLMTAAEAGKVPPILFLEEIEKVETDHALRWLLGLMDDRGTIQRTNYRVGNQAKNVRMVVIATCNDVSLLKKVMYGALYSRFKGNVINFPYPNRETMQAILERELIDIPEPNPCWIEKALEFGYDELGIRDPREIIAIMNVGQNGLINGMYQQDYMKTMHPDDLREIKENKEILENREKELASLRERNNH